MKEYLPLGSIVLLKDATKKIIILGFRVITRADVNKEYDYVGYLYPEGFINDGKNLVFNHSDIEKVIYYGYKDEEEIEFRKKISN